MKDPSGEQISMNISSFDGTNNICKTEFHWT